MFMLYFCGECLEGIHLFLCILAGLMMGAVAGFFWVLVFLLDMTGGPGDDVEDDTMTTETSGAETTRAETPPETPPETPREQETPRETPPANYGWRMFPWPAVKHEPEVTPCLPSWMPSVKHESEDLEETPCLPSLMPSVKHESEETPCLPSQVPCKVEEVEEATDMFALVDPKPEELEEPEEFGTPTRRPLAYIYTSTPPGTPSPSSAEAEASASPNTPFFRRATKLEESPASL